MPFFYDETRARVYYVSIWCMFCRRVLYALYVRYALCVLCVVCLLYRMRCMSVLCGLYVCGVGVLTCLECFREKL